MSWTSFYLIVAGLLAFTILLVCWPWLRRRSGVTQDSLTNVQIVKQRLEELEREASEGVISEHDRRQASDELKLALVDETSLQKEGARTGVLPLFVGAIAALLVGIIVYANVNQLDKVARVQHAIDALPRLSEQLAAGKSDQFNTDDVRDLALAIRQRLRGAPEDARGWMFLGRLWMSLGQDVQAIEAIERALAIDPQSTATRISFAQALMVTGEADKFQRAQEVLQELLAENPENDNLALMMAVVSAQLGDADTTRRYYEQIKNKLPENNDMLAQLASRLAELEDQVQDVPQGSELDATVTTGFTIEVSIAEKLKNKLPEQGFLIVFAQDANSDNRMPAAVIKMPLQNFPVKVTLTTDNAMLPSYSLAQLEQARLVARISTDANVAPSRGDLEGELKAKVIAGQTPSHTIIISKERM